MLQTPTQPQKKYRPQKTKPFDYSLPCDKARKLSTHYSSNPDILHYRLGPGSDLPHTKLSKADLRWRNFRGADLAHANLNGSVLWGAILTNAKLNHADLSHADLTGADLVGADLSDANIDSTCFLGARYSEATQFPEGFGDPEKRGLISLNESMQLR